MWLISCYNLSACLQQKEQEISIQANVVKCLACPIETQAHYKKTTCINAGPKSTPSTIIPKSNPKSSLLDPRALGGTDQRKRFFRLRPYTKLHILGHVTPPVTCVLRGRKHVERKVNYASFLPPTRDCQPSTGSNIFSKYHHQERLSTVLGRNAYLNSSLAKPQKAIVRDKLKPLLFTPRLSTSRPCRAYMLPRDSLQPLFSIPRAVWLMSRPVQRHCSF